MDLYTRTAYELSKQLTDRYSTSFSLSMRLFSAPLRPHIYAIYGMVRCADEIVDSYDGADKEALLNALEKEVYAAEKRGYSTNPIIHAYATTARRYKIDHALVAAFFESMRLDISPQTYDQALYEKYIYGSAEAVGLMCLHVFVDDSAEYKKLAPGAKRLGAGYQKVNFLRDIKADAVELKRWYFPYGSFDSFNEETKQRIVADIDADFKAAAIAIPQLPSTVRPAVRLSLDYYSALLEKIRQTPAETLKQHRIRVSDVRKLGYLLKAKAGPRGR